MEPIHSTEYEERKKRDEKEKLIRCKLCGKTYKKRQSLSRHLGHAHPNVPEVKRERILIDTFFGTDLVNKVIKDFKSGKYNVSNLPINIAKYLNLKGIKPNSEKDKEDTDDKKKTKKEEIDSYCIVKIETELEVDDGEEPETETEVHYVKDIHVDEDEKKVKLYLTDELDKDVISLQEIRSRTVDFKDFTIEVKNYEEEYKIDSVEIDKDDKICTIICKQ